MDPTAISVRVGFWPDYSRPLLDRWQLLVPDYWAQAILAFIAVWLALCAPYLARIKLAAAIWAYESWHADNVLRADSRGSVEEVQVGNGDEGGAREEGEGENEGQRGEEANQRHVTVNDRRKSEGESQALLSGERQNYNSIRDGSAISGASANAREVRPEAREETGGRTSNPGNASNLPGRGQGALSPEPPGDTAIPRAKVRSTPALYNETMVDILQKSESNRIIVWKLVRRTFRKDFNKRHAAGIVLISSWIFGLFIAWAVAGIFSAKIATDRAALSSSTECGIWRFDDDEAGEEAAYRDDLHLYRQEARAGQYARNCYDTSASLDQDKAASTCGFFYQQRIDYHEPKRGARCMFTDYELCAEGLFSAIEFDTGLVDATVIGINAANPFKFRRRTTCSPLNVSEEYVKQVSKNDDGSPTFEYHYGATRNAVYTFNTTGDAFNWLNPAYAVNIYFSSQFPDDDYWWPRKEMRRAPDTTMTIIFVRSMHIYYTRHSTDPVFPAEKSKHFEGENEPLYYNADPRARAFACVDATELCSSDGSNCWSMTASIPQDISVDPGFWLMKWSLESSTTFDSLTWRLGSALLAQESISQSIASNSLHHRQWELEAEQLFATSLARIQFEAMAIATAEGKERPGYREVTPDEAKGQLCGLYKYKTIGYTNINCVALFGLFLVLPVLLLSSLKAQDVGLPVDRMWRLSEPLVIFVLAQRVYILMSWVIHHIVWVVLWPLKALWTRIAELRRRNKGSGAQDATLER